MKKVFLVLLSLYSAQAFADDIQLGEPAYGGSGCPRGSASAVLSPDRKTLSILFDQYSAEAGSPTGKRFDRKSCNFAVPIHIPQGYSIALFQIDYRGFNSLPQGAFAKLAVEYFFAGQRGPQYTKTFYGELNSNYVLHNTLPEESLVWSPCGAETNLRVNSSVLAQSNENFEQTISTVDSADVKAGLVYHVQWRTCR